MLETEAIKVGDFLISNILPISKMQRISDAGMPSPGWFIYNNTLTAKVQGALRKGKKVCNQQKTIVLSERYQHLDMTGKLYAVNLNNTIA